MRTLTLLAVVMACGALCACSPDSAPSTTNDSAAPAPAAAGSTADNGLRTRVEAALAAAERPAADKEIDANRKPLEVVQFFGIESGMTVLDVTAAGGYFTEVLAAAVGPDGRVYAQNDQGTLTRADGVMGNALTARLANNRLPNVQRIDQDVRETGLTDAVDAALVVLTLHDFYNFQGEDVARDVLRAVYTALKPGGVLGFIDHAANAGLDNRALHRIERSVAERLITEAGFTIEAASDVLANSADDHTVGVFDSSIRRRTDQFVLRARKP
ncbi:MAG TPA: SAM-dependent methyltransferase [Gammaproteobacteria bacterium]|nr:SAM-dependent methyltransferase [Gammaproteobacteria bacterium]